jgi:hypothetical protein
MGGAAFRREIVGQAFPQFSIADAAQCGQNQTAVRSRFLDHRQRVAVRIAKEGRPRIVIVHLRDAARTVRERDAAFPRRRDRRSDCNITATATPTPMATSAASRF